jgi:hypothetical protein
MLDTIVHTALESNKHILIMGSARSGTHALGTAVAKRLPSFVYLHEVCGVDHRPSPWDDILNFYSHAKPLIGHIVGFTSKIKLTPCVEKIKEHCVVVNIKRNDKVRQFASWMYFHKTQAPFELWHNHLPSDMLLTPGSIEATEQDIEQFIIEQIVDDFFLPDFVVDYENTDLSNERYTKNQYAFALEHIFSNLDFVKQQLGDWHYSKGHYGDQ